MLVGNWQEGIYVVVVQILEINGARCDKKELREVSTCSHLGYVMSGLCNGPLGYVVVLWVM